MLATLSKVTDLSFVASNQKMWAPLRTENYEHDCATGRSYARELMAYMRRTESPHIFGHVCRAMSEAGNFEGVEIGFCSEIGVMIVASDMTVVVAKRTLD